MERFIKEGPEQLLEAVAAVASLPPAEFGQTPDAAMLLGMGGSALGGGLIELLRFEQQCGWPWQVVRDYRLPLLPSANTRVFALSYSGNTEEVLESLTAARGEGGRYLAVSSGGQLEQTAMKSGIPWLAVPPKPAGFQPRFAIYFMFGVLHEVLVRDGLLAGTNDLSAVARGLLSRDLSEQGREIAAFIGDRIPVVYTDTAYATGVARTWRIKFNENTKIPALSGALPEINHNELIAFSPDFANRFAFLLLPDPEGHPRIAHRFQLFGELMTRYGYPVRHVPMAGDGPLDKALTSLLLADWVSYYLAQSRGIDPIAIPAIQDFKQML